MRNEAQRILDDIWENMQRTEREAEERLAKANPEAYRNSQVMERGKPASFRYYAEDGAKKGETVKFCYTKHRNCAGYFLSFTRVEGKWRGRGKNKEQTIAQRNFHGHKTKKEAIEDCLFRLRDARKPKPERKFLVPSLADCFPKKRRKAVANGR